MVWGREFGRVLSRSRDAARRSSRLPALDLLRARQGDGAVLVREHAQALPAAARPIRTGGDSDGPDALPQRAAWALSVVGGGSVLERSRLVRGGTRAQSPVGEREPPSVLARW